MDSGPKIQTCPVPAVVVFAGGTAKRWLCLLRPGFRHCFVAVPIGDGWIVVDPLSHKTSLAMVEGYTAQELAGWYESHGMIAIVTMVRDAPPKLAPVGLTTCVETVKRVLGIHARSVMTPHQLYEYIH